MIKRKGFSGVTHVLIAIFFIFTMMYFPNLPGISNFLSAIHTTKYFPLIIFFTIVGSALLADLDNDISTATFQLGIIGVILSTGMKIISFVFTSLTRLKNDKQPVSQHRYLWHTPFVALCLGFGLYISIPNDSIKYIQLFKNNDLQYILLQYTSSHIAMFLTLCSIYLGINVVSYQILKFFPLQWRTKKRIQTGLFALGIFGLSLVTLSDLKIIGLSIGIGYMFHIIADLFTQGSAPILWPIPNLARKQWWYKPYFFPFGKIYTGGVLNMVLNFVFLGLNIVLAYNLFSGG